MTRVMRWVPLMLAAAAVPAACGQGDEDVSPLDDDVLVAQCLYDDRVDLCTVEAASGEVSTLRSDIDGEGSGVAISHDRRQVAFFAEDALRVLDVGGGNERAVGPRGESPEWLDESSIAFVAPDRGSVLAVELDSGEIRMVLDADTIAAPVAPAQIDEVAADSDSSRMLISVSRVDAGENREDAFALLLLEDGHAPRIVLGPADTPFGFPDWSPDGERLLVAIDFVIHLVDPESWDRTPLTRSDWLANSPTWSPDGLSFAYVVAGLSFDDGDAAALLRNAGLVIPDVIVTDPGAPFEGFPVLPA